LSSGGPQGAIEPFYFGPTGKPLFGCYHVPQPGASRDCGVVLCYPMGREYIQFHRAFRQLAERLSNVGFPVLRFDFYGCGDSDGDCAQGQLHQWRADLAVAIDEVRRRTHVAKVCPVGLRLGATLAMMVAGERGDIDRMVLWDPVISGKAYVEELTSLHQTMLRTAQVKQKRHSMATESVEILGFAMADALLTELRSIDLLAIRQEPSPNVLLIESHAAVGQGQLKEHLKSLAVHLDYQHLPQPRLWVWTEAFLVPHQILQSVVAWIAKVSP
jgi:exosortase A-associated hydrolase 2